MKFKALFILFNAVIILSFLFLFLLPLILFGARYFPLAAAAIFILTLVAINFYFLRYWRLFILLEREDWPRLMSFLEEQVYQSSALRGLYIKMLINAYLLTSNSHRIVALEALLRERRPGLLRRYGLQIGLPYLLRGEPAEAEKYFGRLLAEARAPDRGWIHWNHVFCLLQQKQLDAARRELLEILDSRPRPLLSLLTLYLLDSFSTADSEAALRVRRGKAWFQRRYSQRRWEKAVGRSVKSLHLAVLSPLIKDASNWVFPPAREEQPVVEGTVH